MWHRLVLVVLVASGAAASLAELAERTPSLAELVERTPSLAELVENAANLAELVPAGRNSNNIAEDARLDVPGLVRKYGYPLEVHTVVTVDGYLLQAHRIPRGRNEPAATGPRPAVLVMHGLMCSSADFVVLGPGNALAYVLADAGYDVWLANARGNFYSRRHLLHDPDDRETLNFWRFSWDEIGNLDLPAFVNRITAVTGQQQMHYIGYSQGTTAFLVLNSLRPEFNSRFLSFQALAPAAFKEYYLDDLKSIMVHFENVIERVAFDMGFGELMSTSREMTELGILFCGERSPLQALCATLLVGAGMENLNKTMLPVFLGHSPAGGALRQILHYSQVQRFNRFARYNFDALTNLARYGSLRPPEYDVSRVTVRSVLHYGLADANSLPANVRLLAARLGGPAELRPVGRASFNHFDFVWGGDVREQLYDHIVAIMKDIDGGR